MAKRCSNQFLREFRLKIYESLDQKKGSPIGEPFVFQPFSINSIFSPPIPCLSLRAAPQIFGCAAWQWCAPHCWGDTSSSIPQLAETMLHPRQGMLQPARIRIAVRCPQGSWHHIPPWSVFSWRLVLEGVGQGHEGRRVHPPPVMQNARAVMHNAKTVMGRVMENARYGVDQSWQKEESSWGKCAMVM